jgi:hypothetical protein
MFPQDAGELGYTRFDSELGENDAALHRDYADLLAGTLREVERLPDNAFEADDWLDRRGLLALLRTGHLEHGPSLERWRTNPQVHCDAAIQAVFGLLVRHATNLKKALPAIESRLEKLPRFLRSGAAVVRKPVPLWTKLACRTCEGADVFLAGVEPTLQAVSTHPARTSELLREARGAFAAYSRAIRRKQPGPVNGFSIGRERFEMLVRERLGLNYSLPEAEAIGRDLIASLTADLKREAAKFGRRPAREVIESAAAAWQPASGSLLSEYASATVEVRERFRAADLLTLPENERLKVMPVPEFLKHQFPTAAYHQPGPFAKKQEGIFWVNDLSLGLADPARRAAEVRQHYGLELTCAHEGYPGHHVQFVTQNRHPSRTRRMFAHAIYYEGWTLWCERMCIEHGIWDSPHARLIQLSDALWRAWRIVIDCGLHGGALSYHGACRTLMEGVGFTLGRAQGDVNWYTSAPTVPMSYLLGRLELEKLFDHCVRGDGWTVRRFNDWILSFGAIPWSWIWQSGLVRNASSRP